MTNILLHQGFMIYDSMVDELVVEYADGDVYPIMWDSDIIFCVETYCKFGKVDSDIINRSIIIVPVVYCMDTVECYIGYDKAMGYDEFLVAYKAYRVNMPSGEKSCFYLELFRYNELYADMLRTIDSDC